jgi:phosphatidylinositol-4,5-bisphosphate 3-kinase
VLADPLRELKAHEQELIWRLRWNLASKPEALPRLLQTADWGNLEQVIEIHNLIQMWRAEGITLEVALQLLDSQYVDSEVRKLAVERLEELSNDNLLLYFLQLVQVLKFEPNYDSVLARFLLRRALQSKRIGHCFYWFLRSEMAIPEVQERFGLLLEAYLRGCGKAMIADLERQNEAIISFEQIATKV